MELSRIERNNERKKIENILRRGLNKKVLVSDANGNVLESDFDYDINTLSNIIVSLIEVYGEVLEVTGFNGLRKRCVFLNKKSEKKYVDFESDYVVEIPYYTYLCYPDGVDAFLNDMEQISEDYKPLDNNTILGGFDEDIKINKYINFTNCGEVDLENLNNYFVLKFIFDNIGLVNCFISKNNDDKELECVDINNLMINYLKKVTTSGELSLFKNNGKVRKKKINE